MTFDEATLMAYADGELPLLERKRIEQAIAADPVLAAQVAAHGALADQLRDAFAPIARAPVPDYLATMLASNVTRLERKTVAWPWRNGLAIAASLLLGLGVGTQWDARQAPVAIRGGALVAAGPLAQALDTQLASASGDLRVLVSFRSNEGYCRVFAAAATDGIACRAANGWQLRQTRSPSMATTGGYRQAASTDAALMAAAQDMMSGEPLDRAAEERARAAGWR